MSIESIRVSNFMTRNVKTETEDQNIQAVCKTMNENNIGSVIVMTPPYDYNQKPVGIITEKRCCACNRTTISFSITPANKRIYEQTPYHTFN